MSPAVVPRPVIVLLVDDQAFVGAAVGRLLSDEPDIRFHFCQRALEAVDLANEIGPTVILQDLFMPEMDGLALLRAYRANLQTSGTPVIVLSGNDDAGARARAQAHGAADYLVKLPGKVQLLDCIRRHARQDPGAPPAASPTGGFSAGAASGDSAGQTLDRAVLAEFRTADAGSSGFVGMLIDQFTGEAASQVAHLHEAAQRLDHDGLKAIAHGLKGSSLTIGALRLAALCGQMERHAARGAGAVVVSVLMSDIDEELIRVQAALAAERRTDDSS